MDEKRKKELLKMTGKEFFFEIGRQLKANRITLPEYRAIWKWWEKERREENR